MRKHLDKFLEKTLVLLMSLMVLNILWQVASRYVLNNPSSFTDELARYLLIWTGLLGAAYATGKNLHLAIDILPGKIDNHKVRHGLYLLAKGMIACFALLAMVAGGTRLVYISWFLDQNSPALNVPLGIVYTVVPLSGLIILFYVFSDLSLKQESWRQKYHNFN